MSKIFFWDKGIRNAVCDRFSSLSSRDDAGKLWENFAIAERMKWLRANGLFTRPCFWRNYNQSEVDYLEFSGGKISALEMKWNKSASGNFNRAFRNLYPDAQTAFVSPSGISDFAGISLVP